MTNFENLFEEVIDKAKEYADVAGKKTSEMVELGKLKYQGKQIAWEIEKTYSRLGAVVYEARKNGGNYDEVIDTSIEELDELNRRLDEVEDKIIAMRKPDFRSAKNAQSESREEETGSPPEVYVVVPEEPSGESSEQ